MTQFKMFLWNYCDHHCGFNHLRFKFGAKILHIFGSDYWYKSKDYAVGKAF